MAEGKHKVYADVKSVIPKNDTTVTKEAKDDFLKNREMDGTTNVTHKYKETTPYVNDKTTINAALKHSSEHEQIVAKGRPADYMKELHNTNIKFRHASGKTEREQHIY